jgi:hypothetical protein
LPKIQNALHKPTYFSFVTHQGVFPNYVHKKSHSLTIFIPKHFLCVFLHIWRRFCNRIMQLKVDNILISHYVVKLMHIWTMKWLIWIHFKLAKACHRDYNIVKGLKNTNFNGNLFVKFFRYKETTIMNNLLHGWKHGQKSQGHQGKSPFLKTIHDTSFLCWFIT